MADLFDSDRESNRMSDPVSGSAESVRPLTANRVAIGRWTIERYVAITRWLVVVTAAVVAAGLYVQLGTMVVLGVELVGFAALSWLVVNRGGGRTEAIAAGVIAGVGTGLIVSVIRLVLNRELVYVVNIVAETMLTAIFGGMVTTIFLLVRKILFQPR